MTFIAQGGVENEARMIVARSEVSFFTRRVNLPNIMEIYSCKPAHVCNEFQRARKKDARVLYSEFAVCPSVKSEKAILTFILVSNSSTFKSNLLSART